MPSDVQIRQFKISDQAELLSFLRLAYPDEPLKSDPTYWKWQFLDNPHVSPASVPTWIVTSENRIVGQFAGLTVDVKVGADVVRAIWVINMIVLEEYRGGRLTKQLCELARDTYSSTMIALGINEQSGGVLKSLDWVWMERINRYQLLLFPGDVIKEIARVPPLRHIVNALFAPFRPRVSKLSLPQIGEVRVVTKFDAAFDELWRMAAPQWPCAVVRSAKYLEWQYVKQPNKKFDVLGYYESDHLLGYVVLFIRRPGLNGIPSKAAITDICYQEDDGSRIIDELIKGALRLVLERHVGTLVTDVLDPLVEERLRRFSFRRIKSSPKFAAKTVERGELMYVRENWFLTRGDSDVSIFEEPNVS